jgi:hypothetical protein
MYIESNLSFTDIKQALTLKCPILHCKAEIGEQKIALLIAHSYPKLWMDYQRMSIYHCLWMNESKEEHVLLCPKCGKYAVLYEPPAKMPKTIEDKIKFLLEQKQKSVEKIQKSYKFEIEKAKRKSAMKNENHYELEKILQEKKNKISAEEKKFDEKIKLLKEKENRRNSTKSEFVFFLKSALGLNVTQYQGSEVDEEKELCSFEISESKKYFVCPIQDCKGCLCVMCMKPIAFENIPTHICVEADIDILYHTVLNVLAENSVRNCPKCGFGTQKDLECTHMTCPKCSTVYCYVCGRPEKDFPSHSLYKHNNWTLNSPPNTDQCPMYLQSKYGDYIDGPRMNGNPANALMRFHQELQKNAIEKLRLKTDAKLWNAMLERHFPKGIFTE